MNDLRRPICPQCGETENFLVDAVRSVAAAPLRIEGSDVEIDFDIGDTDIQAIRCPSCQIDVTHSYNWHRPAAPPSSGLIPITTKVCEVCLHKFECFTSKKELTPSWGCFEWGEDMKYLSVDL